MLGRMEQPNEAEWQNETFFEIAVKTWNEVIGISGYDPINKTINGDRVSFSSIIRSIKNDFIIFIKDKLLIPKANAPQWKKNLHYVGMFFGWLTLLIPAWLVYSVIRNIIVITAKIIVNFVSGLAVNGFEELQKRVVVYRRLNKKNLNDGERLALKYAKYLLQVGIAIFQAVYWIGSATLSPVDNARRAFKKASWWGWLASVITTAIVWAFLLPIVSKFIFKFFGEIAAPFFSNTVIPSLAVKAPWLLKVISAVGEVLKTPFELIARLYNFLSSSIASFLGNIYDMLFPFMSAPDFLISALHASILGRLGISPMLVFFSLLLGAIGTPLYSLGSRLYEYIANKWDKWVNTPSQLIAAPVVVPANREIGLEVKNIPNDQQNLNNTTSSLKQQLADEKEPKDPLVAVQNAKVESNSDNKSGQDLKVHADDFSNALGSNAATIAKLGLYKESANPLAADSASETADIPSMDYPN